ncbi:MAG: response regulator transcription factor [Bacteroidetes bacterium]|nr:response regulator transcription factor [Bacteroidota bacterium]
MATGLKILIVEDSAVVSERIANLLADLKDVCITGVASNSSEAMKSVMASRPDVVLLDISIPGKSGMHVLKEIKEIFPEVKVVMLTNYSENYYRNLCRQLGADAFLDKSTEFEKLPKLLDTIFDEVAG